MGIVFACIAPHGTEVIPELAGKSAHEFSETRRGMEELSKLMKRQRTQTIVLATPHGLRLEATIAVVTSEFTSGMLEANGRQVKMTCKCDRQLGSEILERARKRKLPVLGVNYGTAEGPASCMPLDWGALVPLKFFIGQEANATQVVLVAPSREIPLRVLARFGQSLAETAELTEKRVAFVASADQSHVHKADGPYGFHPSSSEFDDLVRRAVSENDLTSLMNLSAQFVEDTKPDSLWQMAILQGILEAVPMKGRMISYQAPTYYGMLCASYLPLKS